MKAAEFWGNVDTSGGPRACWPWTGATSDGYGVATLDGRRVYAHRVACESVHGPLPTGHVARHMCADRSTTKPALGPMRERACCNPAHLEPGTHQQNAEDRGRAGRGRGLRPRPNPDRRLW